MFFFRYVSLVNPDSAHNKKLNICENRLDWANHLKAFLNYIFTQYGIKTNLGVWANQWLLFNTEPCQCALEQGCLTYPSALPPPFSCSISYPSSLFPSNLLSSHGSSICQPTWFSLSLTLRSIKYLETGSLVQQLGNLSTERERQRSITRSQFFSAMPWMGVSTKTQMGRKAPILPMGMVQHVFGSSQGRQCGLNVKTLQTSMWWARGRQRSQEPASQTKTWRRYVVSVCEEIYK